MDDHSRNQTVGAGPDVARTLSNGRHVLRRRNFVRVVGAGATVGMAGCLGSGSGAGSDTIRIGIPFPLSGPSGEIAQDIQDMIDFFAVEVINTERSDLDPLVLAPDAGLPNLNNREIELLWADHRGDPGEGRAEAERLIQSENVVMLMGALNSGVTQTVSQVAEREQVPHVCLYSSSQGLTERGLNWFWRVTGHDGIYARSQFGFIDTVVNANYSPKIATAAIVHESSEFGSSAARNQEALASEIGLEIVDEITYDAEEISSFSAETEVLKDANPDVVFLTSFLSDGILVMESFRERDYFPPLLMGTGDLVSEQFYGEHPELAEYLCVRTAFTDQLISKVPVMESLDTMLAQELDSSVNSITMQGYSGLLAGVKAIDNAGSTQGSDIQQALNQLELSENEVGAPYGVKFSPDGQNELATGFVQQIVDGVPVLVYPEDLADLDSFVYPSPTWSER